MCLIMIQLIILSFHYLIFLPRSYGIFRVSEPNGMSLLKECQEKGSQFHSHEETVDGSPIYERCTHVYKNSNLRFEIFDLRWDTKMSIIKWVLPACHTTGSSLLETLFNKRAYYCLCSCNNDENDRIMCFNKLHFHLLCMHFILFTNRYFTLIS